MVFSPIFANLGVLVVCGRCQCGYVRLNSGNLCFCVGRGIHSQIVVVCVVGEALVNIRLLNLFSSRALRTVNLQSGCVWSLSMWLCSFEQW